MRRWFDQRLDNEKNARVRMRMLAVRMYKTPRRDGSHNTLEDVAHDLVMSVSWVDKCVKRYETRGIKGLYDLPRSGSPRRIDHEVIDEILRGWRTGKLTGKKIALLYRERTGKKISYVYARQLARERGFTSKKPRKLHANSASPSAVREWQRDTLKEIQGLIRKGFILLAQDEASFFLDEPANACYYAPPGRAAAVVTSEKGGKLTVSGLVSMPDENGRSHRIHVFKNGSPNSELFIELCKKALKKFGRVVMVVDRASWHLSNAVDKYVEEQDGALRIYTLPRSSSYLNIKEGDWRQARMDEFLARHFDSVDELRPVLVVVLNSRLNRYRDVFRHLQRSPYKYNERSFVDLSSYCVLD